MKEAKVEPGIGAIPEIKTVYWYVGSSLQGEGNFRVIEAEWKGSMPDSLRLAKGNVYLNIKEANAVCMQLNERYEKIRTTIVGERQKERLEEDAKRKKEEAARKKAERTVKPKPKYTKEERAISYGKSRKPEPKKVSPHPDIIV